MKLHKFINMNKVIISSFLAIGILLGCKKKEKEPLEYFSFTANGVDYYYPQDVLKGFGTSRRAIFAVSSHNTGFFIEASSFENRAAQGTFRFTFFPGDQIPQQDTIILGQNSNMVEIQDFIESGAYYKMHPPLTGKIIFTERSEEKLSGTFEFEAELYRTHPDYLTQIIWTDTFIHITNGKFSIKPTLQND